jgi:hypothetical protein
MFKCIQKMLIKEERKAIWTWSSIRIGVKNSFLISSSEKGASKEVFYSKVIFSSGEKKYSAREQPEVSSNLKRSL